MSENLYRLIDNPPDGTYLNYLGVHVVRWKPEMGIPTVGFVRLEQKESFGDYVRQIFESVEPVKEGEEDLPAFAKLVFDHIFDKYLEGVAFEQVVPQINAIMDPPEEES